MYIANIKHMMGDQIREQRKLKGLTQEELAKKSDLSVMSIRRYENGDRIVPEKVLKRIADSLELPISFFSVSQVPADIVAMDSRGNEVVIPGRIVKRIALCMEWNPFQFPPQLLNDDGYLIRVLARIQTEIKAEKEHSDKTTKDSETLEELEEAERILNTLRGLYSKNTFMIDERLETIKMELLSLNDAGQEKVVEYAKMLGYVPYYKY